MELTIVLQPLDHKKILMSVDNEEYGIEPLAVIPVDLFYKQKESEIWLELCKGHEVVVTVTIESYELEVENEHDNRMDVNIGR